jgi:acetyl/propionyl-CoA carboxylase alpha subunit
MPAGPGVRVDTAIREGDRVPPEYDNLIAKLLVDAPDRGVAIRRLRRALDEVEVAGIQTTLPFHRFVARNAAFHDAAISTTWVDETWDGTADRARARQVALVAAALAAEGTPGTPAGPSPGAAARAAGGGDGSEGGWSRAALEGAIDRWPA